MLHGHGDETHLLTKPLRANFSSNVWPAPMPEEFYSYLKDSLANIGNYPAPCAENLATEIANYHTCTHNEILVCNGATEAFYLIAHAYKEQNSLIAIPSFSEYEDACTLHNHSIEYIPNTDLQFNDLEGCDLVWLCNPNNPDGFIYNQNDIKRSVSEFPKTTFIIDEAYLAFSHTAESSIELILEYDNIIIVKSLTKQFHMPGLRLGYVIGSAKQIAKLQSVKMPWTVNSVANAAGEYIFKQQCIRPQYDLSEALSVSLQLQTEINQLENYSVLKNNGCFFLVKMTNGNATDLQKHLLNEYNILIRDASNFRGLTPQHFRIASQSVSENQILAAALKQYLQ